MTTTTDNNRPFFNSTFFVALSMSLLGASLNLGEEGFTATSVIFAILAVVIFCRASDAIDDAYDRADRADRALARVEAEIVKTDAPAIFTISATGTGTANQTITLPVMGLTIDCIAVFISGLIQRGATDYTVSGITLTLIDPVVSGEKIIVRVHNLERVINNALDAKVLPRDQRLAHDIADLRARVSKVEEASNYAGGKPSLDDEPRHDREEDA